MSKTILIDRTKNADTGNVLVTNPPKHTVHYRNFLDLILSMDRTPKLAALRSLTSAIQFTMINTADWIARKELGLVPSEPTLDARNEQDEFARYSETDVDGNSTEREVGAEFGFLPTQTPQEKLVQYSNLYWSLAHEINVLRPANQYERPNTLKQTLEDYMPRGAGFTDAQLAAIETAEMEPGEFDAVRAAARAKKAEAMDERKPRIKQLLDDARHGGQLDEFMDLPVNVQLRLATSAWKGVFFRRKGLVSLVAASGRIDELGAIKLLANDLDTIETWCREFEEANRTLFETMIEADVRVYTIDDAKADVRKPRGTK